MELPIVIFFPWIFTAFFLKKFRDAVFLIDWKTASAGSNKDINVDLSKMYDDPLQVAAYVGAVNSDPNFSLLPTVRSNLTICKSL